MRFSSSFLALVACTAHIVSAAPNPVQRQRRENELATTLVSVDTINSDFLRPAQLSRLAYCTSEAVQALSCGAPCDDLGAGSLQVLQTGGDGGAVPRFFVAFDSSTQSVVVSHQGTNSSNPLSVINDLKLDLRSLNATLFPQIDDSVQVHDGFASTQEQTADVILSTVQSALASTGATNVLVTGHSLGGAVATLDALMLRVNLDQSVQVTSTTFGTPRGGNQAFADLIDSQLGSAYTFITNGNDPVPRVPPTAIFFQHPSGEVHIVSGGDTVACPGQENENCIDGNSLFDVSVADHLGPYFNGVSMGGDACPA